jgi:anti-anti-sigma factor
MQDGLWRALRHATPRAGLGRDRPSRDRYSRARESFGMLIRTWSLDAVTIIDVHGRFGVENDGALLDAVSDLLRARRRDLVLNLLGVTDVDAAGLGELASAISEVRAYGGVLKIVVRGKNVRELLIRTHLLSGLSTFSTEAEAIASFDPTIGGLHFDAHGLADHDVTALPATTTDSRR